MPPKKQIQLQIPVETQEEWKKFISEDGVAVMDVYSEWCGPCKAVAGLFRRIKNELGDDLLRFGLAKSDNIEDLEPYRDNSMPTFLFYSQGVLIAVVRGAMGPLLERTIKEKLIHEHKVLEGEAERVQVVDEDLNIIESDSEEEEAEDEDTKIEPKYKQYTVLMIKPDAVQEGKVEEIVEAVKSRGLEILAQEERQFTKEQAEEFYQQHKDEDFFEDLVEFICSGPCVALVVTKGDTGEGVVEEIRELVGPKDVSLAKEEAPESIRATYGTDTNRNAVHASDSYEVAARELAFFMPKFKLPYVPGTEPPVERTLALIRPDALAQHKEAILGKIMEAGFKVAYQKELTLTKEQAEEFYKEHKEKEFFDSLTTHMSSGPVLALCLAREDAVTEWRRLLGSDNGLKAAVQEGDAEAPQEGDTEVAQEERPNLRKEFSVEGDEANPLHGSDSPESANEEINFFFPVEHTVGVIKPSAISNKEEIIAKIEESGFKISMANEMNITKDVARKLYNQLEDKDFFDDLTTVMSTGSCMVMVLSRPDAVQEWRSMIGPADPNEAKEQQPNSLRALYGNSVLENAVHGSSTTDHALKEIEQLIGPVNILPDGSLQTEKEEAKAEGDAAVEGSNDGGQAPSTDQKSADQENKEGAS